MQIGVCNTWKWFNIEGQGARKLMRETNGKQEKKEFENNNNYKEKEDEDATRGGYPFKK